ncbi:MAG: sigma-70 family RNA polymerase sigma factor [Schwartzia sp.]|nr:sigma-70 family RNA polymerase sigma factor [Schwartzia sp. (in: firmicutes)]
MKGECMMPLIPFSGPLDFETIYRKYHKSVYNYIYGQILHREPAEDLTADVFVAAASNISRFDPSRGDFAAWLFTIARNLTLNYRLRASTRMEESREEVPLCFSVAPKERDDSLRAPENLRAEHILAQLSDEERRFLELRYVLDLSNEEIGRVVGTTAAAVSQRYHRLLAKCRKLDMDV